MLTAVEVLTAVVDSQAADSQAAGDERLHAAGDD